MTDRNPSAAAHHSSPPIPAPERRPIGDKLTAPERKTLAAAEAIIGKIKARLTASGEEAA